MFRKLFSPDSGLMITMSHITDCIFLSLFWLVGCFLVITAGMSTAALYDAVYRAFRKNDKHSWSRFLHTFRNNWKASLVPSVVLLAGVGLTGWGLIRLWNGAVAGTLSWMLFAGGALVGMLVLGIFSLLCPMLSRFENSTAGLLRNTLLLSLANMPRTLLLGMLNAATGLLCLRFVFPLFFLPGLAALLGTYLIEPMFRPYLPEETEEALQ